MWSSDCADALDGYYHAAVATDAADGAFKSFKRTAGYADALAGSESGGVRRFGKNVGSGL